ncbi:MAG: lytic murein transglycosylase [Luteitalea sp.]|nr:lytic murein transglycosylase [Luteitalea sp.]
MIRGSSDRSPITRPATSATATTADAASAKSCSFRSGRTNQSGATVPTGAPPRLIGGKLLLVSAAMLLTMALLGQAEPAAAPETRASFAEWLDGVRSEALTRGIRQDILDQALGSIDEPLPIVIERDRTQAEVVLPLETYISRRLTPRFLSTGKQMFARHRAMLEAVEHRYGVPGSVIASIWGIESNFGRFSGVRPTIPALATLAWDRRRATFFRRELFSALEILNRRDIEPARMRGSWAGAMGQPQFMPSSYLEFAEDYDGDGRRDIWNTPGDIFASVANYLKGHGWVTGQLWGREVKVSREVARRVASTVARREGSCQATRDMTVELPLDGWQRLGVRTMSGSALPKADITASLVAGSSRYFLVYRNYHALLQYNCAHAYALSVALVSDRLRR